MIKKLTRVFCSLILILFIFILTGGFCRTLFPTRYQSLVRGSCSRYNVSNALVFSLMKAESNFDEKSVSHAGAKGLMQLTDQTYAYCMDSSGTDTLPDIFSPENNIDAGVWYLSHLLERYDGNTENAVAAYNAGATNVDKWLKDNRYSTDGKTLSSIPFGETKRHVEKIRRYTLIYKILYPDIEG